MSSPSCLTIIMVRFVMAACGTDEANGNCEGAAPVPTPTPATAPTSIATINNANLNLDLELR